MNPMGLLLLGLGIVLIVVGFKGSQSKFLAALKGAKPGAASTSNVTGSVQAIPNSPVTSTASPGVQAL